MEDFTGYYQTRSGEGAAPAIEALVAFPVRPLSAEEKALVYDYESALFRHAVTKDVDAPRIGDIIRTTKSESTMAPPFFAKAFIEGEVGQPTMPTFTEPRQVYAWIACVAERGGQESDLRKLAKDSLRYYTRELSAEIASGKSAEAIDPLIAEACPIVLSPACTLEQFKRLQQARHIIRAEYLMYKPAHKAGEVLSGAKCAVLDIYLAKVNDLIAEQWPMIAYIQERALLTGNDMLQGEVARLMPSAEYRSILADQEKRRSFFRRLDYVRHGMGRDVDGKPHAVARHLWELAAAATIQVDQTKVLEPIFTKEEGQKLREAKISPDENKALFTEVLRRADKLSAADPDAEGADFYSPERRSPAFDNRWQVVYHPTKNTYAVDSVAKVFMIPHSETSWRNALVVGGGHELEHINQGDADNAIGQWFEIANVRGKRTSPLREGRANDVQRDCEYMLFGELSSRVPAMTYASAITASWERHDLINSAVAFYETRLEATPTASTEEAAREAADRAVRLLRGGTASTQVLSYDEYRLLVDAIKTSTPAASARVGQVTCFDIPDQLRLHRYGLLPDPPERLDFMPLFLEVAKSKYEKVLIDV